MHDGDNFAATPIMPLWHRFTSLHAHQSAAGPNAAAVPPQQVLVPIFSYSATPQNRCSITCFNRQR